MKKIGIMGGTFDPIHNGHLLLGRQAYEEYHLDEVWFMPSGNPPHKKDHTVTPSRYRCDMTRLAIEGIPYFAYSGLEAARKGNTYTAQTLKELKALYPEDCFYFIIGEDSLYEIESWYHPEEVMKQTVLMVAHRSYKHHHVPLEERIEELSERYQARIMILHCPQFDVSSAQLREMAAKGLPVSSYVPGVVADYMEKHHLYQEGQVNESADL